MPKILKATDYGSRKVFAVCLNPDEPRWIHVAGDQAKNAQGVPLWKDALGREQTAPTPGADWKPLLFDRTAPAPADHTGNTDEPGIVCHNCRYNWREQEFIFERADQFVGSGDEARVLSDAELVEIIKLKLAASATRTPLTSVVGRVF